MSNHIPVTVFDWMCNEENLVKELTPLLEDYCSVTDQGRCDNTRLGIKLSFYDYDIPSAIEAMRLKYDVMLTGDDNEIVIWIDKKNKKFRQR
jgi:hypothetical protein